jgi:hypothetical protein
MKKFALFVFNGDPMCFIQGLKLLEDVLGHPGMARYHDAGFEIITF